MAKKTNAYKPVRNELLYRAMVEIRRSSAAQPQDSRPNRLRTRSTVKTEAIRSSSDS